MWHMKHGTWCGVNIISSSHSLGVMLFWIHVHKPWVIYLTITKLFEKHPGYTGSVKYKNMNRLLLVHNKYWLLNYWWGCLHLLHCRKLVLLRLIITFKCNSFLILKVHICFVDRYKVKYLASVFLFVLLLLYPLHFQLLVFIARSCHRDFAFCWSCIGKSLHLPVEDSL